MKKLLLLIALPLALVACEEEYIGQYPVDDIPPQKVSNAQVENLPGRVVISYKLPSDTDLLYVKAVYTDSHGKKNEVRASNFKNKLEIKGFAKSEAQKISLISVDRSQNESEPLTIEIEPLDSPIYTIQETMDISASWGGFKINWENPDKEQLFMYIYKPGEEGDELVETIISADQNGFAAVRGLEATEQEFKILIRDVYENYTDTVKTTLTPLYETFIEGSGFTYLPMATDMNWHKSRNNANALFDGVKTSDKPIYMETKVKDAEGYYTAYFTVDLVKTYKFSRIKFWGRVAYAYALHCPKHFQFWGTTSDEAAANPDSFEGWNLLYDGWSYKPSGYETADVTAEDKEYAQGGEEFEIPESSAPTRYFRFVCLETWTKSNSLNLNEMEFYGAEIAAN